MQYTRRFAAVAKGVGEASGSQSNFYYSFDDGLMHFVAIDTGKTRASFLGWCTRSWSFRVEVYTWYNETQASQFPFEPQAQLDWLRQDLIKATANRHNVPWIVMFGHKVLLPLGTYTCS